MTTIDSKRAPDGELILIASYQTKISEQDKKRSDWKDIFAQLFFVEGVDEINIYKMDLTAASRSCWLDEIDIEFERGFLFMNDCFQHEDLEHYFTSVLRDLKLRELI